MDVQVEEDSREESEPDSLANISNTAILEYLEVVKSEYDNERNKKQSFENRAGLIMALLGAICIFLFEQVKVNKLLELMGLPINYLLLIKITCGILVYFSFFYTMVMVIKTITVQKHGNFEVKSIDETLVFEERTEALLRIIFTS